MPLYLTAALVLLLDQFTKQLALRFLAGTPSVPVFSSVFHLTLVENTGIAFGIFSGAPNLLFWVLTVSIGALFIYSSYFARMHLLKQVSYGLILGGAVGNWLDRIWHGHVIDFLDFRVWPVFNLADTCISVGIGVFILITLRGK